MTGSGIRGPGPGSRIALAAVFLLLAAACGRGVRLPAAPVPAPRPLAPAVVDATTLDGKLMFGYQGWFGCPDDGSPGASWRHWFARGAAAAPQSLRVDMWPDTSELDPGERCPTPLTLPGGDRASLYSAYNPRTVARHFRWLADYGLPGMFLQRFSVELRAPPSLAFRDGVTRNVRAAAEAHGRVFAIMYDVTGHPPGSVVRDLTRDWVHLVDDLRVTDSPRYLRHRGRPLLAIWGLGFSDRQLAPDQAAELIAFLHDNPDPRYRVTLLGGVPAGWRTRSGDADPDPRWTEVYRSLDVVSPWTVGRFRDLRTADRFYRERVRPDLAETTRLGLDYAPVLFPGFSWHNLNAQSPSNRIPRLGGRFFWRQVVRALDAGATMLYAAMFDEVDEGTAMFKVAATPAAAPDGVPLVTLDADGEAMPSDWYLRLAREAQRRLAERRGGTGRQRSKGFSH